jgi:hypothetical protein
MNRRGVEERGARGGAGGYAEGRGGRVGGGAGGGQSEDAFFCYLLFDEVLR